MRRLILIGNGFDLAHGMKTSYNDFMLAYIKKCFTTAEAKNKYDDIFWTITFPHYANYQLGHIATIDNFIDFCYETGQADNLASNKTIMYSKNQRLNHNIHIEIKSPLFKKLVCKCSRANWVEIENEFYAELKLTLDKEESKTKEALDILNSSMNYLIEQLNDYLVKEESTDGNDQYTSILKEAANLSDNPTDVTSREITNTMILNFNYTSTIERYMPTHEHAPTRFCVNYIHGKLGDPNNPIIFGFGDELDPDYSKMENSKIKGFFKYIKSFWYFKTRNYHDLIRFIDSEAYQVYVMGHSCGLSDRTMLNMIFEHNNCKSIKVFFYQSNTGNNYTDLTEDIARHFRNKADMRRKIVPLCTSSPMPQA